jgi:S-adenosylmethionine:diacylglycerol 3-amino-3-carboxypropyl transferase
MQPASGGTAWDQGRFDRRGGPKNLLFGRMYEDPAIEAEAFPPGGRVLCIASAGCTARKLAERHEVVAVDINPVQLAYARRRLAGAPAEVGSAERVMAAFRRLLPLAGVSGADLREFLALDRPEEQIEHWNRRLCTRRFRLGLDTLLSVGGLRVVYASPFLHMVPRRFGRVLLGRMERCFATHPNRTNPYARALFLGEPASDGDGPAKGPIDLVCADVAAHLEAQPAGSFSGFTLSNILDGASAAYRARLFAAVKRSGAADASVVLRSFAEPSEPSADNAAPRDRSMIWGVVQVTRASDLP